jgi:uncharacterized membrane protein YedE/YeeE
VSTLPLIGAFIGGVAFGYGAQQGAFCMNSGFRGILDGNWTKVKALALAVAVQLVVLPALFVTGLARPTPLPFQPIAGLAGGMLFGLSMPWAGACAAGVWYKLGAGDLGSLLALLGMALGATASESGPLSSLRAALQDSAAPSWKPDPLLSVSAGLLLLLALARSADARAGQWSWRRTGLWIGVTAVIAWPASAAAGRSFGVAVVPGTTGLLATLSGRSFAGWDVVFVVGVLAGGWIAARRSGRACLAAPPPFVLLERFVGGLGLGVGASIASGCTVGHGLTGLALLSPVSFVVTGAIFVGASLNVLLTRRLELRATGATSQTSR